MSLFRTLAHPKQQRWLGRHNDSHILPPADTVHNPCRDQSVITSRAHRSQYWHADFDLLVSHNGMGKDIWNVPFEDITMMLKVSQSRCFAQFSTGLIPKSAGLLDRAILLPSRRCLD